MFCEPKILRIFVSICAFTMLFFSSNLYAQGRPKIGLVLSGGGALGSAHIGVLKALEELRIPVDMIAGTSMGAIVGGHYAAGYSPQEIEDILSNVDWSDLFDDEPRRRFMDYRDKFDDPDLLTDFEMGFSKGRFRFPPGLIIGRKVDLMFQMNLFDAIAVQNFSQLPTPFVAIATDLISAETVELNSGVLADAIRASATIPGAFAPVEDAEGRLLVDGGLIRNLPVTSLLDQGADYIIAVDVGVDEPDEEELKKLGKITARIVSVFVRQNVRPQADKADMLIVPDMTDYNGNQFDLVSKMVPIGYETTQKMAEKLQGLQLSIEAYETHRKDRKLPQFRPKISSIQISNTVDLEPRILLNRVTVEQGETLDLKKLEDSIRNLYRLGYFQAIHFRLTEDEEGQGYHLLIEPESKSWGPNYIRFGLEMNTDFAGVSGFNFKASHRTRPLNRLEGEINTFLTAGEQNLVRAEYFQPLTSSRTWFTALGAEITEEDRDFVTDQNSLALVNIENYEARASLGYHLGSLGELRFSYFRSHGDARVRTGETQVGGQTFEDIDINLGGLSFEAVLDRIDNFNFPTDGWLLRTKATLSRKQYGADDDYEGASLDFGVAHTFKEKHTLISFFEVFSSLDSQPPVPAWFEDGGLYSLSGFPKDALRGRHGGHITFGYLNKIFNLPPPLGGGVYFVVTAEMGNMWEERSQVKADDLIFASAVAVGADTALGPVNLAYGFNDTGENQLYFTLGRSF